MPAELKALNVGTKNSTRVLNQVARGQRAAARARGRVQEHAQGELRQLGDAPPYRAGGALVRVKPGGRRIQVRDLTTRGKIVAGTGAATVAGAGGGAALHHELKKNFDATDPFEVEALDLIEKAGNPLEQSIYAGRIVGRFGRGAVNAGGHGPGMSEISPTAQRVGGAKRKAAAAAGRGRDRAIAGGRRLKAVAQDERVGRAARYGAGGAALGVGAGAAGGAAYNYSKGYDPFTDEALDIIEKASWGEGLAPVLRRARSQGRQARQAGVGVAREAGFRAGSARAGITQAGVGVAREAGFRAGRAGASLGRAATDAKANKAAIGIGAAGGAAVGAGGVAYAGNRRS